MGRISLRDETHPTFYLFLTAYYANTTLLDYSIKDNPYQQSIPLQMSYH